MTLWKVDFQLGWGEPAHPAQRGNSPTAAAGACWGRAAVDVAVARQHPHYESAWRRIRPASLAPERTDIFDHVPVRAVGDQAEAHALRYGRRARSSDRAVVIALIERLIYGAGRKETESAYKDLLTKNGCLHGPTTSR